MFDNKLHISMYRYNPEEDKFPYMKENKIDKEEFETIIVKVEFS